MYQHRPSDAEHLGASRIEEVGGEAVSKVNGVRRPRRVLGDITNARKGAAAVGQHKGLEVSKRPTKAAATVHLPSPASRPGAIEEAGSSFLDAHSVPAISTSAMGATEYHNTSEDLVITMQQSSSGAKRAIRRSDAGESVEDMDLAHEVDDVDVMHVEVTQELGGITQDLGDMTILQQQQAALAMMVDNVDALTEDDPQHCVEYVEDQYKYYREKECRPGYDPMYMAKQKHINGRMRAILIDWLVEVHYKFKFAPETLYLTINILDRFLDRKMVPRDRLQLVGITAFLIASKYEEIYAPEVKELVYMTNGSYDRRQVLDMESRMLATLKFNVTVCTAHSFLVRFLKAGHAYDKLYYLASYICERTLLELDILHFLPSMIAASAVYLARKNLQGRPWSPTLTHYTQYNEEMLLPCLRVMTPWLQARSTSLQAINNKYSSKRFCRVSRMELEGMN